MENAYFGIPYWGLRHLISPCTLSAARAFHSTGMAAFSCKTHTLALVIGGCGTSFRLARYLPRAPSTAQECQNFQCKMHTLALLIGGCGTSFRLARPSAAPAFHSTEMSAFPM